MKISYSFSPTPASAPKPPERLVEYSYNEFLLDLPEHWRQIPTPQENSFNWHSDVENASITLSADFYEMPEDKATGAAEKSLESRLEALEQLAPGRKVSILHRSIKPHSQGVGLEMSLGAEIPGHVYLFVGYVTSRKIFNFTLVSSASKHSAADLFNTIMRERLRVMLP